MWLLTMKEIFLSLLAGLIVGVVFKLIKLPIPAPPVLSAVVGIFGIYFGGKLVEMAYQFLDK
jgi:XapX domain-containing protein